MQAQTDWGTGGDNSRALAVVTGILVGGVAGQGGTQLAANASAPYAVAAIGDYFKTKGNENQTLQDLSHAVLGATLAYSNGASAVGGALAGGGAELAAQILTKQLYPDAFDANGKLQRDKLTPAQSANITALSSGIGALLSGVAGGMVLDAAVGGNIATNAVENNEFNNSKKSLRDQAVRAKLEACQALANPAACIQGAIASANAINRQENLAQFTEDAVKLANIKAEEERQAVLDQKRIDATTGITGVANAAGDQVKAVVTLPKTVYVVGKGLIDGSIAPSDLATGLVTPFIEAIDNPNSYNVTNAIFTLATLESPAGKTSGVLIKGGEEASVLTRGGTGIKAVGSDANAVKIVDGASGSATVISSDGTSLAKIVNNDAGVVKVVDEVGAGTSNLDGGFKVASKSGFDFETTIGKQGDLIRIDLVSNNKFDKITGEVTQSTGLRSELEAYLSKDGNLSLKWYSTDISGKNIGKEMISTAIEKLGPENVKTVSARLGRDNWSLYEKGITNGLSNVDAAWQTPLGKAMSALGYKNLEFKGFNQVIFKL